MTMRTLADTVWTGLSVPAQQLLVAYGAGLPFVDPDALFELQDRGLYDPRSDGLTKNGVYVFKERS